jgi:hypothetical protein
MTYLDLSKAMERLKAKRDNVEYAARLAASQLLNAERELDTSQLSRALLQRIALLTQSQIKYRVTTLGTMALAAVSDTPVRLELKFSESRGKTEARLLFERQDSTGKWQSVDPIDGDSGGMCSVSALGLRAAMREAQRPRTRPILIMDEIGNHVNDPTREMLRKFADMILQVSDQLRVQFLLVSTIPELLDIGEEVRI